MKIGRIIKRMRELRGMTQQDLGEAVGFPVRNAATRIAQYETNYRIPKKDMADKLAKELGISPFALSEPNFESYYSLFQAFIALEDEYGAKPEIENGQSAIAFGKTTQEQKNINDFILKWHEMKQSFDNGKITKDEYDEWRYSYPIMEVKSQKSDRTKISKKLNP